MFKDRHCLLDSVRYGVRYSVRYSVRWTVTVYGVGVADISNNPYPWTNTSLLTIYQWQNIALLINSNNISSTPSYWWYISTHFNIDIVLINEALQGWGSGKIFLYIIFKIQENFKIMISYTIEMLFIVYSNTFLHKMCFFLM